MIAMRIANRDAAEELSQEVMIAALCSLREGKAREPERLAAFGIARNLANDYIRRCARGPKRTAFGGGSVGSAGLGRPGAGGGSPP